MKRLRAKLTFSNVVAVMALFIALGGASYAATQLPKNSIGAKQLKKGAVTAAKIKNGAVSAAKLDGAAKAGMVGPQGPQGAPGSAKAWAEVDGTQGIVLRSGGAALSSRRLKKGYYCVGGSFNTLNSVALGTLNFSDPVTNSGQTIAIATTNEFNDCGSNEFAVRAYDGIELDDAGFIIAIP